MVADWPLPDTDAWFWCEERAALLEDYANLANQAVEMAGEWEKKKEEMTK